MNLYNNVPLDEFSILIEGLELSLLNVFSFNRKFILLVDIKVQRKDPKITLLVSHVVQKITKPDYVLIQLTRLFPKKKNKTKIDNIAFA